LRQKRRVKKVEDNKGFVYALRHNPTGKYYVGCTRNVERRIHDHITQLKSGTHPVENMQKDFDLYGNDYSYFVLFEAYYGYDAFMAEKHFMSLLNSRDEKIGYNYKDQSHNFSIKNFREHKLSAEKSNELKRTNKENKFWNKYSKHKYSKSKGKTVFYYLRIKNGLTLQEVADKLGVSKQIVSVWEQGGCSPKVDKLSAIANLFSVPVDSLLCEELEA
jgi:group I intron endonuclease